MRVRLRLVADLTAAGALLGLVNAEGDEAASEGKKRRHQRLLWLLSSVIWDSREAEDGRYNATYAKLVLPGVVSLCALRHHEVLVLRTACGHVRVDLHADLRVVLSLLLVLGKGWHVLLLHLAASRCVLPLV